MNRIAREDLPVEFQDDALGESRIVEIGGMTVAFERWNAGLDTTPMYQSLPDGACQASHWGYVVAGRARIITKDGEEEVRAGDAYYMPPGHNVAIDEDLQIVEFTGSEERAKTMAALAEAAGEE